MDTRNVQQKVLEVTNNIEKQVDAAIEQMGNLDINNLEQLRKQSMQEMKLQQGKPQQWLQNGQKMFFNVVKKLENVVIHFFTPTNTQSLIANKHFQVLAAKHLETRFVSLNAEKCLFFAKPLYIRTLPSIVCVKNSILINSIVGFIQLGNIDNFKTEVLEWRLAQNKTIDYDDDLSVRPDPQEKKEKPTETAIRDGIFNNESDDDLEVDDYSDQFNSKSDLLSKNLEGNVKKEDQKFLTPEEELELNLSDEEHDK